VSGERARRASKGGREHPAAGRFFLHFCEAGQRRGVTTYVQKARRAYVARACRFFLSRAVFLPTAIGTNHSHYGTGDVGSALRPTSAQMRGWCARQAATERRLPRTLNTRGPSFDRPPDHSVAVCIRCLSVDRQPRAGCRHQTVRSADRLPRAGCRHQTSADRQPRAGCRHQTVLSVDRQPRAAAVTKRCYRRTGCHGQAAVTRRCYRRTGCHGQAAVTKRSLSWSGRLYPGCRYQTVLSVRRTPSSIEPLFARGTSCRDPT
jgi:hypothetical protein